MNSMDINGGKLRTITNADSDATPNMKLNQTVVTRSEFEDDTDMFSCLPKETIHKIMLLLSASESTRLRVLSKHLSRAFRSLPVLDIDYDLFRSKSTRQNTTNWATEFQDFVRNSIQCRDFGPGEFLNRLTLRATSIPRMDIHDCVRVASAINLTADFATCQASRELVLDLGRNRLAGLPPSVFRSGSLRKVKLSGLSLSDLLGSNNLLVFDCPLLEALTLSHCSLRRDDGEFSAVKFSGENLKAAELSSCQGLERVDIDAAAAARLESFTLKKFEPGFGDGDDVATYHKSCEIVGLNSCSSLKYLELDGLDEVDERWLTESLDVSVFAELEALKLRNCRFLKRLVSTARNERLKSVDLRGCYSLERVDVAAPELETFRQSIEDRRCFLLAPRPCVTEIGECKKLKSLVLRHIELQNLTDEWVRANIGQSYGFGLLEELVLEGCDLVGEVVFRSERMRRLELRGCRELRAVEVDAPNLVSFVYGGAIIPVPPVIVAGNFDAEIHFDSNDCSDHGLFRDFISHFGHCKTLTLVSNFAKLLLIPLEVRYAMYSPLLDLRHLDIRLENGVSDFVDLIDSLLWLVPYPNTISITFGSNLYAVLKFYFEPSDELNEDVYEDEDEYKLYEDKDDDDLICCHSCGIKCWRHNLISVEAQICQSFKRDLDLKSYFMKNSKATFEITMRITPQSEDPE